MISLTKRYHFSASHRLHVDALTDEANAALFGKCNNPFGHGHNYVLSVTITGEPDCDTGLLLPLSDLDALVESQILSIFDHRNLNVDVAPVAGIVPTTENVALVMADLLVDAWPTTYGQTSGISLSKVHLQETARNGFEINLRSRKSGPTEIPRQESVSLHV